MARIPLNLSQVLAKVLQDADTNFEELYNAMGAMLSDFSLDLPASDGTQVVVGSGRYLSGRQENALPVLVAGETLPLFGGDTYVYLQVADNVNPATLDVSTTPVLHGLVTRPLYKITSDGVNITAVDDYRQLYLQPALFASPAVTGIATGGQTVINVPGPVRAGTWQVYVDGVLYSEALHYTVTVTTPDVDGNVWSVQITLNDPMEVGDEYTVVCWK